MEHLKDFFKSRKEVEQYFGNEVFKFEYMGENTMFFKTLNPKWIDEELVHFELGFYFVDGNDFFAYSSFEEWLDKFQLQEVRCISEETHLRETMYFDTYKRNWKR